jgi:2-iminobutanoate/2-iminopropanoate deaminase
MAESDRTHFISPVHAKGMPFCDAVLVNGTLYLSGAIGWDYDRKRLPEEFIDEARQTLKNIGVVLHYCGFDYGDVVKALAFLSDMSLFDEWNRAYREFFSEPYPARSTVAVAGLALGARLEVEMIAVKRGFVHHEDTKES